MIIDALGQGLQAAGALGDGHPTPFLESCLGRGYGSVDVFFRFFRFEGLIDSKVLPLVLSCHSPPI